MAIRRVVAIFPRTHKHVGLPTDLCLHPLFTDHFWYADRQRLIETITYPPTKKLTAILNAEFCQHVGTAYNIMNPRISNYERNASEMDETSY